MGFSFRAPRREPHTLAALLTLVLAAACAKSSNDTPLDPSPSVPTITITASGASPRTVEIAVGGRVRFVNKDTAMHMMGSDPHPDHTDCPDINQVGFLLPEQVRETGNFVQPRTCGFHDHERPDVQALRGTITIR
jgi:hypothetical protein